MTKIKIAYRGLPFQPRMITIDAEIVGSFGIHFNEAGWDGKVLTHLASGFSVARGLKSDAAARKLAEALEPLADWSKIKKPEDLTEAEKIAIGRLT